MKRRMRKWFLPVLLILLLCLAGCFGSRETVLTIGVYSGSYWNTPTETVIRFWTMPSTCLNKPTRV